MDFIIISILLAPLLGFLLLIFFQREAKAIAGLIATLFSAYSLLASIYVAGIVLDDGTIKSEYQWFGLPDFVVVIQLFIDSLAAFMFVLVNFISLLVHIFSIGYMHSDKHYARYFAYLGLFTFSMLGLLLSDNLLLIYIFWELVGFCSYLLIGFWYQKGTAVKASYKAFIVNRIGDLGFLTGILILAGYFGTFQLSEIQEALPESLKLLDNGWFTFLGICLFCGCIAKSAQFPLQIWLPDAMEGPTPVSALIHAATMVAAGIYLLARVFFLLNAEVLQVITWIGIITAFIGAFSALNQSDFKKVLAYSTISQLGYMVMGMGLGAYQAGLFHLFTHAFFKAGLFLCAGYIIHYLHHLYKVNNLDEDAQNIYLMGGLRKEMPVVFLCFSICAFSLMGLPFTSGFLSKDLLLSSSLAWAETQNHTFAYLVPAMAFLTVFLTAIYSVRLYLLIFFGENRLNLNFKFVEKNKIIYYLPIIFLSVFSLGFVFSFNFFDAETGWFFYYIHKPFHVFSDPELENQLIEIIHRQHVFVGLLAIILSASGFIIAYFIFKIVYLKQDRHLPYSEPLYRLSFAYSFDRINQSGILQNILKLSKNHFYLDYFYQTILVGIFIAFSQFVYKIEKEIIDKVIHFLSLIYVVFAHIVAWFDRAIVDGFVNLLAFLSKFIGSYTRNPASGRIQAYIIYTLVCLVIFGLWIFIF